MSLPQGFGCHVLAYDVYENEELTSQGVEYCSLEKLLAEVGGSVGPGWKQGLPGLQGLALPCHVTSIERQLRQHASKSAVQILPA